MRVFLLLLIHFSTCCLAPCTVQASLQVHQVQMEMHRFVDAPLVYLAHPVAVRLTNESAQRDRVGPVPHPTPNAQLVHAMNRMDTSTWCVTQNVQSSAAAAAAQCAAPHLSRASLLCDMPCQCDASGSVRCRCDHSVRCQCVCQIVSVMR
jgi:hypothetical protein